MSLPFVALALSLSAEPLPPSVDVSARQFMVATDSKKRFIAFDPKETFEGIYIGDGKTMYQVPVRGGGGGDGKFDWHFWEPRALGASSVDYATADGKRSLTVTCGEKKYELTVLPDDAAKAVLSSAKFVARRWTRMPDTLLRDDSGTYYFVDRLRTDERRDFRLYIGPRGKLTVQALKDIVDDTEGMIFSTKNGDLRLVTGKGDESLKWVKGGKETKLVRVPLDDARNARLVYGDLGVYDGAQLGTPCDDAT